MPIYQFLNEKTNEIKEILQPMDSIHEYEENGVKWLRLFSIPNMAIDTVCDPYSTSDFLKCTNKSDTIGSMIDRSKELSLKRADKEGGRDPVKEKFYKDYSKTRRGLEHVESKRAKAKDKAKKAGFSVEF